MINVLEFLGLVGSGKREFAFVPSEKRYQALAVIERGVSCLLDSQIVVADRRTVWCQQHDALTLQPTSARNYEMPSACGSESAGITMYLMRRQNPDPRTCEAIRAAAAWLEKTRLTDVAFKAVGDDGRLLIAAPGADPVWSRYYDLKTDRPIFGDRDKTIHDDIKDISKERRDGYSWFSSGPSRALIQFAAWNEGRAK